MSARRSKSKRRRDEQVALREPAESRAAELLTIAWTVSVTGVLIADLMSLAAHFLAQWNPESPQLRVLASLLLLSAAGMGIVSLALLAATWKRRTVKPPQGFVAFAACVAIAPGVAVLLRLLT